jgi:hypothetical protein
MRFRKIRRSRRDPILRKRNLPAAPVEERANE